MSEKYPMYCMRYTPILNEKRLAMSKLADLPQKMRDAMTNAFECVPLSDEVVALAGAIRKHKNFKPELDLKDADLIRDIAECWQEGSVIISEGLDAWILQVAAKLSKHE